MTPAQTSREVPPSGTDRHPRRNKVVRALGIAEAIARWIYYVGGAVLLLFALCQAAGIWHTIVSTLSSILARVA